MGIKRGDPASFSGLVRRGGQILIPTLLAIPSLFLFVYLIFETTKLSREKIRHQFAVDSAAFIQMSDYTNLLNRTAYVNGAFPYRIFKEAFACPAIDGTPNTLINSARNGTKCKYDLLYDAGAFPKYQGDTSNSGPAVMPPEYAQWDISFSPVNNNLLPHPHSTGGTIAGCPASRLDLNTAGDTAINQSLYTLITHGQVYYTHLNYRGVGEQMFQFYSKVYYLLGGVELSQWVVFKRLTADFAFFRSSYNLNTNEAATDESLAGFRSIGLNDGSFIMHYIEKIAYWGRIDDPADLNDVQGEYLNSMGYSTTPMDMRVGGQPNGLFQLATIRKSVLATLRGGVEVRQGWTPAANFFNETFTSIPGCSGGPCVKARVSTECLKNSSLDCVWPKPTPKYQTRLYP